MATRNENARRAATRQAQEGTEFLQGGNPARLSYANSFIGNSTRDNHTADDDQLIIHTDKSTESGEGRYTAEEIERARKLYRRAIAWKKANPTAWSSMKVLSLGVARRGRRFGSKFLAETIRQHDIVQDTDGEYFRLSNDLTAVFARMIMAECPEIADKVRIRSCPLDEVMGITHEGKAK